jgi:hypothetical protein
MLTKLAYYGYELIIHDLGSCMKKKYQACNDYNWKYHRILFGRDAAIYRKSIDWNQDFIYTMNESPDRLLFINK